jgi:hypothetical protein
MSATRESMVQLMGRIAIAEGLGSLSIGHWAAQSAEGEDRAMTEILEIVRNRERENAFLFRHRLEQLGESLEVPAWAPGGPLNDGSLTDIQKLGWLYDSAEGFGALDHAAGDYKSQESAASDWPEPERSLMAHYLFTERHSTKLLADAWMARDPDAALASDRFAEEASRAPISRDRGGAIGLPWGPVMGPLGENLDNWDSPYR